MCGTPLVWTRMNRDRRDRGKLRHPGDPTGEE